MMVGAPPEPQQAADLRCDDDEIWFFAYTGTMRADHLARALRLPADHFVNRTRYVGRCDGAFLVWDVRGIPYIEPCHPNLLILGVNETPFLRRQPTANGLPKSSADSLSQASTSDDIDQDQLWRLASPGIPHGKDVVRSAEGVAWRLKKWEWLALAEGSEGYRPVELPYALSLFAEGGPDKDIGTLKGAWTLIAKEECRVRPERGEVLPLPSHRTIFTIRPAGMQAPVSQPYQGHLFLIRFYDLTLFHPLPHEDALSLAALNRRRRLLGVRLFKVLYAIPFVLVIVPLRIVKPWLSKQMPFHVRRPRSKSASDASLQLTASGGRDKTWDTRVVEQTNRLVWSASAFLERWLFGPVFGSGWTTD